MSEKKLFPGVNQKDVLEQERKKKKLERKAELDRKAEERKNSEQKTEQEIESILSSMNDKKLMSEEKKSDVKKVARGLGTVILSVLFLDLMLVAVADLMGGCRDNGRGSAAGMAMVLLGVNAMAALCVPGELVVLLIFLIDKKRYKNYHDAAKMMLDLKELGGQFNLNTHQIKRLVDLVPDVISHMSSEERVYFDLLMEGKINIKENKTFFNMAVAVMKGHLESHPEDAKRVLEVFEEASMPTNLLLKCRSLATVTR